MYYWILIAYMHLCGMFMMKSVLDMMFLRNEDDDDDCKVESKIAVPDGGDDLDSSGGMWTGNLMRAIVGLLKFSMLFFWEIVVPMSIMLDAIEKIIIRIANRKYELMYYDSKVKCDGDFEYVKGEEGLFDRLVCKECGFEVEDNDETCGVMDNNPVLLQTAKNRFEHQCKTQKWLEFEKSFWYRMAQ
jgi:hypothetical protein